MSMAGNLPNDWLDQASAADLDTLATALSDERLKAPFTLIQIQQTGLPPSAHASLCGLVAELGEPEPATVAWLLRRLARERRETERRWAGVARLVWSGPLEGHEPTRDTRQVLDEMFSRAEHHVLISTYVIYDGRKIFKALASRMQARPELEVDLYVNLPSLREDSGEEEDVAAFLKDFRREQWPPGARLPGLFYDPDTRKRGQKRVTLHAKMAVVDERWALVTSANFTEAAQARNIEAGVLLDHTGLASTLVGRFRSLRDAGKMRPMTDPR